MEQSVKVFDGIFLTLTVESELALADIRKYLDEQLFSSYHCPHIAHLKQMESKGRNTWWGRDTKSATLVIQFFRASDAVKFKLVFGGSLVGVE